MAFQHMESYSYLAPGLLSLSTLSIVGYCARLANQRTCLENTHFQEAVLPQFFPKGKLRQPCFVLSNWFQYISDHS